MERTSLSSPVRLTTLQNQTYHEIAQKEGYSSSYFANVVAPELYRRLSKVTGKRVTKRNCRAILQSYFTAVSSSSPNLQLSSSPGYPCGTVPLDSPFYLKQPSVEQQIIQEITVLQYILC